VSLLVGAANDEWRCAIVSGWRPASNRVWAVCGPQPNKDE